MGEQSLKSSMRGVVGLNNQHRNAAALRLDQALLLGLGEVNFVRHSVKGEKYGFVSRITIDVIDADNRTSSAISAIPHIIATFGNSNLVITEEQSPTNSAIRF